MVSNSIEGSENPVDLILPSLLKGLGRNSRSFQKLPMGLISQATNIAKIVSGGFLWEFLLKTPLKSTFSFRELIIKKWLQLLY